MNDLSVRRGPRVRSADRRSQGQGQERGGGLRHAGVTLPDVHGALDRAAQASMTPAARVRDIWVQAERMERAQQIFLPLMEGADDKAAMIVIKAQEGRATLLGSNAPIHARFDPIQQAQEAVPQLMSADQLGAVFNEWRALDKKRL